MAGEWETVALDSLIEPNRGISYGIVQPGAPVADGVPIVRVSDVRDGRVVISAPLRVAPAIEAAYARTRLSGGELLLTLVGTVGEAAVVPASLAGWNTARAVAVIPVRKDVGAYWVQLALRAPGVRAIIDSRLNTTVQATLNLGDVAQLPIVLPPIREREAIAHILGTLDDKIELNRRMNETLRETIRLLFHRLNDGAIKRSSIADLAEYINGRNFTKDASGNGRMVIRIAELNSGRGGSTVFSDADAADEHVARLGDILFAWSGSLGVYRWYGGDALINQHIFKVLPNGYPRWFVHQHLLAALPFFRETAADKATTMGHIKRGHLSEAKVGIPTPAALAAASEAIEPLDERIGSNERESRTLAALRDALLPKLISGELRIRDAERTVGEPR